MIIRQKDVISSCSCSIPYKIMVGKRKQLDTKVLKTKVNILEFLTCGIK